LLHFHQVDRRRPVFTLIDIEGDFGGCRPGPDEALTDAVIPDGGVGDSTDLNFIAKFLDLALVIGILSKFNYL
jgi:hypothetical protein